MVDPLAHPVDPSAVPGLDFHGVQQSVIFMIAVYKSDDAGEKLLQRGDAAGIVPVPDVARVSGDEQHIAFA